MGEHTIRLNAGFGMILLTCSCGWEEEFNTDPFFFEVEEAVGQHEHDVAVAFEKAKAARNGGTDVCAIGKVDDGTLRVCCSTHQLVLCAHHYAVTHFVEVAAEFDRRHACNAPKLIEESSR